MLRPILIVDDNADDVDALCRALRRAEVRNPVQSFPSGEDVIDHLSDLTETESTEGWLPILCLLDVKMPGFHGAEVLQWIRGHHQFRQMPVAICSSSADTKDVNVARQYGAQCYLKKYPNPDDIGLLVDLAQRFTADPSVVFDLPANLFLTTDA